MGDTRRRGPLKARIRCESRSAAEVLKEANELLRRAAALGRRPVVELERFDRIAGSASNVLKGLAERLVDGSEGVTFRDRSGYAEAFLEVVRTPRE